jgi:hypothetical protein
VPPPPPPPPGHVDGGIQHMIKDAAGICLTCKNRGNGCDDVFGQRTTAKEHADGECAFSRLPPDAPPPVEPTYG